LAIKSEQFYNSQATVKTPSTKTLAIIAILSMLVSSILVPSWYPAPIRAIEPDGKVQVHRDMAEFNRALIPSELLFVCGAVCVTWLLIRFLRFLWARLKHKIHVV
jgi:hypothetical protein